MKTARVFVFMAVMVSLLAAMTPRVCGAETAGIKTYSELADYYLQQRAWIAPIIPPFLPDALDYCQAQIASGDYSFQQHNDWYFSYKDGTLAYAPAGEIGQSISEGEYLVVYEDLQSASTRIVTTEGKQLAEFKAEPWPNLSTLSKAAYDTRFLAELNKRSIALWFQFRNDSPEVEAEALEEAGSGGMMMLMGGESELEVVGFALTNDGMAVTFAWPGAFTNRLDIYSCDGGEYKGFGSWKLADIGFSAAGTNQLRWLDSGQLGRGAPFGKEVRFYTAGVGSDVDTDGDGYSDSYEQLVLNTDPENGDTDGDGVSDGPFDPDNDGPIIAGPDAFPLDPNEWLDTDGDGIGDNADTDDDGDGIPDNAEASALLRLLPRTVAPFNVVTVEDFDPAGDDSGTELFDVSSAGRMLPYAAGGTAKGHGRLHGGIYFNHDGSNLYIGVAGFEKDGNNSLMIFLDTDGTNGGVASMAPFSGNPDAFGRCDNLSFNATSFTPNVGILVGNRYADGRNDRTVMGLGQGVYSLTPPTAGDFPGFSSSSGAISQWGDRGTDSANAGIEIALSLANLGLSVGDTFKAAAIINGGVMGDNRWFSGECYGETASGTLDGNNFGGNAVTLIGAEVYLSDTPAPEKSGPPPLGEDDVILQGYYWKVPRVPRTNSISTMTVAGNFNGWNTGQNNMKPVANFTWEYIHTFASTSGVEFKFVSNGSWTNANWGDNNQTDYTLPITGQTGELSGANIKISNIFSGPVRFRINTETRSYEIGTVATGTVTTVLPEYSTNFWYPELTQLAQEGRLSKFTAVWLPPPQKCNSGRDSVGYDPFDYYDVGTYPEKFSTETRYGSEAQLKTCVNALRDRGILPIVDLVLNHMNGGYAREGGTGRYNYQPEYHETFEKPDPAGNNSNQYFTVNYGNEPFSYDVGYGNPDGVNPWDGAATSADVNQRHPYQRQGIKNWATWVSAKAGYRGYRWDVAQNIEPWFISETMNYQVMKDQFGVMEFWTDSEQATVEEFETWLELTDRRAAMFDQRIYQRLEQMCNLNGTFEMWRLRTEGLVNRRPQWAVTLAGDHDKIRPYAEGSPAKWGITKDKAMAYAFILISEGVPMVAYNDYYIGPYADPGTPEDSVDDGWTGIPLTNEIDRLVDARRKYAGGSTVYLSQSNTNDLFIMKRVGNENKPGCILVLNDNISSPLSDTVNTGWISTNLVDVFQTNFVVNTDGSGNASLSAPARSYRVFVRQGDL